MDFEQFIYIAVAIVWAILGWYNKKQKEKEKEKRTVRPDNTETQQEKHEDIKTILEEILLGREQPAPTPKHVTVPTPQYVPKKVVAEAPKLSLEGKSLETLDNFSKEMSKVKVSADKSIKAVAPSDKLSKKKELKEDPVYEIDIKQAIIYSEILKRPVY